MSSCSANFKKYQINRNTKRNTKQILNSGWQLRDRRQITIITLNVFCLLSKKPHPLLLLPANMKLDGILRKIKMKNTYLFYIVFQVLKVLLKLPVLFISCFTSTFTTFHNLIQNY